MTTITFTACDRSWTFHRPADLESLWDAIGTQDYAKDERLPYWVELWPSSLGLVEWLIKQKQELQNKICLDIGCGLGFTALVGQMIGARVLAMDYEPEALVYAKKNARSNNIPQPLWFSTDWRFPCLAAKSIAYAWAGDIMYERNFAQPICDFINHILAPKGKIWIAEPGRKVYNIFVETLQKNNLHASVVHTAQVTSFEKQNITVTIWEIQRS